MIGVRAEENKLFKSEYKKYIAFACTFPNLC